MRTEEIRDHLQSLDSSLRLRIVLESLLVENPEDLARAVRALKSSPRLKIDFLSSVTAADYLDFLETVYHFYSVELRIGPVVLRARTRRDDPKIPSLCGLFRSAELQEREAYDMFGIRFEGHPDLRRLFMWDNFEGWPLRKDYVQEDSDVLESQDLAWLEKNSIHVSQELKTRALDLQARGLRADAQRPAAEGPANSGAP
ncbi:MAG: NADH-quinone oxidoreductase subunit C [Candidatus Omnitrophica bacterium]|nr:NADH-quinone oxidoreductase subunit C [Candidatus Omnitrophota bacterium]